jgi:hypothetical protein
VLSTGWITSWKHHIHMVSGASYGPYEACIFRVSSFTIPIGPHRRHPPLPWVWWTAGLYRMLKTVTGFKKYSIQISKKVQSIYVQKSVPAEIWAMSVWYLKQIHSESPMHFDRTFSPSSYKGAHSVENSFLQWIYGYAFSSCCNTSKSLIGAECTNAFSCPHSQKSRGLSSGDHVGQLDWPPRPDHCSPKIWFRCRVSLRRKWGDAPSCMNHMCCLWWRGTCSKSTGKSFTKEWFYTAPVNLLGKTTGPKCLPPKMPTLVSSQMQNSPIFQQAFISGHVLSGNFFAHLSEYYTALKFVTVSRPIH